MHIQQQKRNIAVHVLESQLFKEGFSLYDVLLHTDEDYNLLDITVTLNPERAIAPTKHRRNWIGPMQASA